MNKLYPGKIRIIAGQWRGRVISVLDRETLRPTPDRVRETLFNWLQSKMVGARCLDCFAGTGILSFEALSRGAKEVTMVDSSSVVTTALKHTMAELKIEASVCQIINQDVLEWLSKKSELPYDIIFLDPPFEGGLLQASTKLLDKNNLLTPDTLIYIEAPADLSVIPAPIGWVPIKSKIAGKVGYHLLAKSENPE